MNRQIITSLCDIDLYKILMLQFIWKHFGGTDAALKFTNRTTSVRLTDDVEIEELREQLDSCRELRFSLPELNFLASLGYFEREFILWLSSYKPGGTCASYNANGQLGLFFLGNWAEITLWEIYSLAIVSELRTESLLRKHGLLRNELENESAKVLAEDLDLIGGRAKVFDFGTRRRASKRSQERAVQLGMERGVISATSNVNIAMNTGLKCVGTIAHEIPMAMAALTLGHPKSLPWPVISDVPMASLIASQHNYLNAWDSLYGGKLRTLLPDTFTSDAFFKYAPDKYAEWEAIRIDSKDPMIGGDQCCDWWKSKGQDLNEKTLIFSDGLTAQAISSIESAFGHSGVRTVFGWGTNLTNNYGRINAAFKPISTVVKLSDIAGEPTVKLSDNVAKATGPEDSVSYYKLAFGVTKQGQIELIV